MADAGTGSKKIKNAKLVLLGDVGTGKSSLVLRFVKGQFIEFQESTIGAAFFTQTLSIDDETVKLEIWDTAGQERYHALAPMYYRGAQGAIVLYDISNADTFARAKNWIQELKAQEKTDRKIPETKLSDPDIQQERTQINIIERSLWLETPSIWGLQYYRKGSLNTIMALVGNKADLVDARKVSAEEAQTYAQENGLFFIETSAKTATNVNGVFYEIANRFVRMQPEEKSRGMVLAADRSASTASSSSCCSSL